GDSVVRYLLAGREHRQREGDVEAGAHLAQEGRGQVRREPALRELVARVLYGRPDTVARLAHGRVPEAHDRERRKAGADVDLDPNEPGIDSVDRERGDASKHAVTLRRVA